MRLYDNFDISQRWRLIEEVGEGASKGGTDVVQDPVALCFYEHIFRKDPQEVGCGEG